MHHVDAVDGADAADAEVARSLGTYLDVVDACAPGLVEGLYVVGSYALGDWRPGRSDIDVIAVTAEPATDDDAGTLLTAHALLAERQPTPPIDGPYLAWGDLVVPPMDLHRPWTLGGTFHHDAECSELNPVTWYVLAHHGVTVRGPTPDRLGIFLDLDARVRFVVDNLDGYWRQVAEQVAAASARAEGEFTSELLEWCVLGPLRLHRTAFVGDVVSKLDAGRYGLDVAPSRFHDVLRDALARRASDAPAAPAGPDELRCAVELMRWCIDDVTRAARDG